MQQGQPCTPKIPVQYRERRTAFGLIEAAQPASCKHEVRVKACLHRTAFYLTEEVQPAPCRRRVVRLSRYLRENFRGAGLALPGPAEES